MAEYIVDTTNGILKAKTMGELVRCRDCVWGRAVESIGCIRLADRMGDPCGRPTKTLEDPDGHCAWGRRDDAKRD